MSETDKEASAILSSLASLSLQDHSDSSKRSPITLETLPNELLSAIFLHLDDFILPPLSKRLLPFHRAQLYRKVSLDLRQFKLFRSSLQCTPKYCESVEEVTLKHLQNASNSVDIPRVEEENNFLQSLVNLRRLTFVADEERIESITISASYFEQNPKLEIVRIRSSLQRYTAQDNEFSPRVFDLWQIGAVTDLEVHGVIGCIDSKDPRFPEAETLFEVEREDSGSTGFTARYFGVQGSGGGRNWPFSVSLLPIHKLQMVWFDPLGEVEILGHLPNPELLGHLSLHTLGHEYSTSEVSENLDLFPNLTHLSLGGSALVDDLDFYETLDALSLEYFHAGRQSILHVQPLLEALTGVRESNLSKLKTLILDNLDALLSDWYYGEEGRIEWYSDPFPEECSFEEGRQLITAAENLGIELSGSTIEAMKLYERIQEGRIQLI
ncbi:hypothetical protein JCM3765_005772 [Sporobolomyces pararoseus]